MRKVVFFVAVTGTALLLTGCPDPVMRDRRYIPVTTQEVPQMDKTDALVPSPEEPVEKTETKPAFKYEPMTDATAAVYVDSAPKSRSGKSSAAKAGSYIVKRGDTPERIARKHGVKLSAFMSANNLDQASARRLRIGQKLIIPGKGAIVASKKAGKKIVKSDKTSAPVLDGGKYVVKSGDTPERIARRFKIKLAELLQANNLDESSARRLQIGQKLIIPGKSAVPETQQESTVTPAPVPQEVPAVPVPAVENSVSAESAPEMLPAPAVTTAPAASAETVPVESAPAVSDDAAATDNNITIVEVPADMTFAEFAAQQGVSEAELRKINSGNNSEKLSKGAFILVPKK